MNNNNSNIYVFFYGSKNKNAVEAIIGRRLPFVGKARVTGVKRVFTNSKYAKLHGKDGVATLITTGCEFDEVLGILFRLTQSDIKNIDKKEGVHKGKYEKKKIIVEIKSGNEVDYIQALCYVMTKKTLEGLVGYLEPSNRYLEEIAMTLNDAGWKKRDRGNLRPFVRNDIPLHEELAQNFNNLKFY